ncbi:hypothetical protein SO802_024720 [Lithocarpus litseifolius]|uniref:UPF3 domain-containing protein n=1 Tax=Lithocarpus litseifolius TaxID=425828 RepID=A0AAW2CBZ8_9ROSI
MKEPSEKTKVVVRHLPPSLTHSDLSINIDEKFSGRYNWFFFRPGKYSLKNQRYSRAYIDFKRPEDVFEFAEFFDGHVFVNEKGAQYKVLVEYAPSQKAPKSTTKKDGREGTIYKDPDYLEFLKVIAKPAEHLPSAEIQLERKEAEQAGSRGEMKDMSYGSRNAEATATMSGRNNSVENGSQRHFGRRGAAQMMKDDGSVNISEGKSSRRGVSGHSAHEGPDLRPQREKYSMLIQRNAELTYPSDAIPKLEKDLISSLCNFHYSDAYLKGKVIVCGMKEENLWYFDPDGQEKLLSRDHTQFPPFLFASGKKGRLAIHRISFNRVKYS